MSGKATDVSHPLPLSWSGALGSSGAVHTIMGAGVVKSSDLTTMGAAKTSTLSLVVKWPAV